MEVVIEGREIKAGYFLVSVAMKCKIFTEIFILVKRKIIQLVDNICKITVIIAILCL